ncbi:hypothetical protein ACWGDT_16010 [Streptomyces avermitilis]
MGRLDEARLAFEEMLTRTDHLVLYTVEINHTGGQLANHSRVFILHSLIGAAFGLDHVLG